MDAKKVSIQLNPEMVDMLEKYSADNSNDINDIVDQALESYLHEREDNCVDELIHGYMDMAQINEEISNAFSNCEQEADQRSSQLFND